MIYWIFACFPVNIKLVSKHEINTRNAFVMPELWWRGLWKRLWTDGQKSYILNFAYTDHFGFIQIATWAQSYHTCNQAKFALHTHSYILHTQFESIKNNTLLTATCPIMEQKWIEKDSKWTMYQSWIWRWWIGHYTSRFRVYVMAYSWHKLYADWTNLTGVICTYIFVEEVENDYLFYTESVQKQSTTLPAELYRAQICIFRCPNRTSSFFLYRIWQFEYLQNEWWCYE